MPRWFKITLAVFGVLALSGAAVFAYAVWSIRPMDLGNIPVYKEYDARTDLMTSLSNPECLTRDTVLTEATARGWTAQDLPSLGQCPAMQGVSDWLKVTTPDGLLLPENPENATFFGFDETSCSVFLPVGAGIGVTCPDPQNN